MKYPRRRSAALPDRFPRPAVIDTAKCPAGCGRLRKPLHARRRARRAGIAGRSNLGKCLFCTACAMPALARHQTHSQYTTKLAARSRSDLTVARERPAVEVAGAALDAGSRSCWGVR